MKKFLLSLLFASAALLAPQVKAQGFRYDNIALNQNGQPIVNANVRVCAGDVTSGPVPCSTPTVVYSDQALTVPLAQPIRTGPLGNYGFFIAPGTDTISFYGTNITGVNNILTIPCTTTFTGCAGSVTVAGNLGDVQMNGGVSTLSAAHINDGGTIPSTLLLSENTAFKGVNPWVDVTAFGARAVQTVPQTTVTISSTSTSAALAAASTFQNGDGVVIYGAGATNTLSTPAAPTVSPSEASAAIGTGEVVSYSAATTYNYKIVARDKNGGLTAASTAGTTTTGAAALGAVQTSVTSLSRSNNIVTVTTSAPSGAIFGAIVYDTGSSDASFSGHFVVSNVIDGTHFQYAQGMDTRGGASASATGGTVQFYVANHVTWSAVGGAWQYYVYGSVGAGGYSLKGVSRPGELFFDDFGYAAPALPDFVPSTPPGSAINDYLSTTIVSGAGTTSLVLANAAINSVSTATIKFDDAPAIKAAWTAAGVNNTIVAGSVRFPSTGNGNTTYVVNSHLVVPVGPVTVLSSGGITLNETMEIGNGGLTWDGTLGGSYTGPTSFAWAANPEIFVVSAYPGIVLGGGDSNVIKNMAIFGNNNGLLMTLTGEAAFENTFTNDQFLVGGGGANLDGIAIIGYGQSTQVFQQTACLSSTPSSAGSSLAPCILYRNDIANATSSGDIFCRECFFVGAGFAYDQNPQVNPGSGILFDDTYAQALRTPIVMVSASNTNIYVRINKVTNDTSPTATLANWGTGLSNVNIENVASESQETGGFPGVVTGNPIPGLRVENAGLTVVGQNVGVFKDAPGQQMNIPVYSPGTVGGVTAASGEIEVREPMHFPAQHTLYWDLASPSGITATVAAGGSLPVDVWTYYVAAVGIDGGVTTTGAPSTTCTTSSGHQTCNVAWTAVSGATGYLVFKSGVSNGYFGDVNNCVPVNTNACVDTSAFPNNGNFNPVAVTGTGGVSIGPTGITTLALNSGALTLRNITGITQCLQANTSGVVSGSGISCGGTAGANTSLSNLVAPTALNADLLCASSGSCNIGSPTNPVNTVYAQTFDFNGPYISILSTSTGPCAAVTLPAVAGFCSTGSDSLPQEWDPVGSAWADIIGATITQTLTNKSIAASEINSGTLAVAQGGTGAATAAANTVFGNFTGSTAAPGFTAAPTFSAANLTNFPTLNQNTSGTAANLSGTPALPSGTAATTQSAGDNTTKLATDAFVIANGVPTLVQKQGSATGTDYTTTSATAVAVDGTNLTYTVTIPVGSKLTVNMYGYAVNTTGSDYVIVGLGSGTCSTILNETASKGTIATAYAPFSLSWQVTGDGASHTLLMCFSQLSGGTADISNGSPGFPVMDFRLEVSN